MRTPDFPAVIPDLFEGGSAPGWAQHAEAYVLLDGLPVWLDGRIMWAVINGAWQVIQDTPEHRHYYTGRYNMRKGYRGMRNGAFTLIGPNVNGNPYMMQAHMLFKTCGITSRALPITPEDAKVHFETSPVYGLLYKGTRGRWAKATREQFGLAWPDYRLLDEIMAQDATGEYA